MNDNNNDAWCKAEAYDTSWALDRRSNGSQHAFDEGMHEALEEIRKRGEELKSAAFDGPPTPASRKAEGALLLWRKAYDAAYRELLAAEEWDRALARGAGLNPSINQHPFEQDRDHARDADLFAYMAELDAKYPDRLLLQDRRWWKEPAFKDWFKAETSMARPEPAPKQADGETNEIPF